MFTVHNGWKEEIQFCFELLLNGHENIIENIEILWPANVSKSIKILMNSSNFFSFLIYGHNVKSVVVDVWVSWSRVCDR